MESAATLTSVRALLREDRFSDALAAADILLRDDPENRDARLFTAVAQRFLGRVSDALNTLSVLEQYHPRFSRLYEERGSCFVALKQAPEAIASFLTAVNLNHALPSSWRMLEGLYRLTGESAKGAMAADHVATLSKIPPPIVTATSLFMDGDLEAAEARVRAHLLEHGDHVEGMRLLARIGMRQHVFDDAELLFAALLELAPDYREARKEYAEALLANHKYPEARAQLDRLLADEPNDRFCNLLYANTAVGLGEHESAVRLYGKLLQGAPQDAELHLSIGHALKTLGSQEQAIAAYQEAAKWRPNFGDAYWSLANLKTYRFGEAEIRRMQEAQQDPSVGDVDRYHFFFASAKALEDRGDFAEAYRIYQLGNALKRNESKYRPDIIEENTRRQIKVCTREFFLAREGWGIEAQDPIFIVGLPRAGSTLIEQILASHSRIEGTQELSSVQQIVAGLRGRDLADPLYPAVLRELTPDHFEQFGRRYLESARVYRTGKEFFIDKMPNNFRHLGLIHLMFPRARIIDARREPMACCFSNLKQLFAQGQEFTYSIEDIARYYRTYLELMRHWENTLPARILRVNHEDVVDDLEGNVRRIMTFCGVEFESRCVEFHKTVRSIRTASSEQVRRPLNRDGVDQWRNFERWLGPLDSALGDARVRWRE